MLKTILAAVITTLFSENFEQQFKAEPRSFTRKKKLTFPITIILILRLLKKSLSVEILNFIEKYRQLSDHIFFLKVPLSNAGKK